MANTVIALKKSGTPSATPSGLANGELAINYADGKLFYKAANGAILAISGSGGSGGSSNSFSTINANSTLVIADSPTGILTIVPGNNITVVGDAINDKITIGLTNDVTVPGVLFVSASSGNEGGELRLATAVTNSVLSGPSVVVDIYQNNLRFFENGGSARGAFINLAATAAGVGTDLLATGGSSTDTVARTAAGAAFDKANSALPNTNGVTFAGTLTASANLVADKIISTNNGQAENFKIGDDAWIGDINQVNTFRVKGQQNSNQGYIVFGDADTVSLGRTASGNLTYGGNTVWHAGIDGAGSGLDADLLDGQHGSYYSGIGSAAFDKANSANVLAYNTGIGANVYATTVGTAGNTYLLATLNGANTEVGAGANTVGAAAFAQANSKFSSTGGTINGDVNISGNLSITGNTIWTNVASFIVNDPLIYLAGNNYVSDIVDIGFVANYVNATGSNVHTGVFRDAGNKEYYVFEEYNQEPYNNVIDTTANGFQIAILNTTLRTSNIILGGINTISWIRNSYNAANIAIANVNYVNTAMQAAFTQANSAVTATTLSGANTAVGGGANTVGIAAFAAENVTRAIAVAAFTTANSANAGAGGGSVNVQLSYTWTNNHIFTDADASVNNKTGAIVVTGGIGVTGNVYTANRFGIANSTNVSVVYTYYNSTTNSLDTVFG